VIVASCLSKTTQVGQRSLRQHVFGSSPAVASNFPPPTPPEVLFLPPDMTIVYTREQLVECAKCMGLIVDDCPVLPPVKAWPRNRRGKIPLAKKRKRILRVLQWNIEGYASASDECLNSLD